jgi:hypothetical protein
MSLLPIFQKPNCPVNIPILRFLVAAAGEQYHLIANLRVIDPVSGADINSQLADTVPQELAVPKQTSLNASDTLDDGDLCQAVTQAIEPILVEIVFALIKVMDNFIHAYILAYKRISARPAV